MSGQPVSEYEVFRNEKNALAFFMARQNVLDSNPSEGPFWFTVEGQNILAGTGEFHAVFEDVEADVIEVARQRGVLLMIEFENQQPVRCTPCYLSEHF